MEVTLIRTIGTYLPPWGTAANRTAGVDEDAVTMAVAAGRAALGDDDRRDVHTVVLVSRDLPLLVGGNSAALLGGLNLPADTEVREQLGGAPAAVEAIAGAADGTLVIGSDLAPAGAAAVWCGTSDVALTVVGRINRSLPVSTRDAAGGMSDYADPRLLRERGVGESLRQAGVDRPYAAVAGVGRKEAAALSDDDPPALPTLGASAGLFALAALAERGSGGRILGVDQATLVAVDFAATDPAVIRNERPALPVTSSPPAPGAEMAISLPAYERAFDAKVRLEAAKCTSCGTLALPPRFRCIGCGSESPAGSIALPRDAVVYTTTTVHVPVPGLATPYSLVLAELGDTGVRILVQLTGARPGAVAIGDRGALVFRRIAIRSGVPDYGYSFLPEPTTANEVAA